MSTNETLHNVLISHEAASMGGCSKHNSLAELSKAKEDAYFRERDRELIAALRASECGHGSCSSEEKSGCCGKCDEKSDCGSGCEKKSSCCGSGC